MWQNIVQLVEQGGWLSWFYIFDNYDVEIKGLRIHVLSQLISNGDIQASQYKATGLSLCASLSVDDIGIRKSTQLVQGGRVVGYPDLGPEDPTVDYRGGPTDTPATHIMVFMLTMLNDSTKIPCGFFIHDDKFSGKGI